MLASLSSQGSSDQLVRLVCRTVPIISIRQLGLGSLIAVIMADGRIPLRELVTNQNRGQLEILLAAGTSIQLENLKSKVCSDSARE